MIFSICYLLLGIALSMPIDEQLEIVNKINNGQYTWKARYYKEKFALGVLAGHEKAIMREKSFAKSEHASLPATFDVRDKWPQCNAVFNNIRNQGQCGSCWAVSSASVFSDRKCIETNGAVQTSFSGEDTLSCCHYMGSRGCHGGWPAGAWSWFIDEGVVSGGNYSSDEGCKPYTFCSPTARQCETPVCTNTCFGSMPSNSYTNDKHRAFASYRVTPRNIEGMKRELYEKGSLVVIYAVYTDFYSYSSGVYQRSEDAKFDDYHAVRLIGWGNENGVDYWLIANSWGSYWGMNGFFKIRRGVNECGIENDPVAGLVSSNLNS